MCSEGSQFSSSSCCSSLLLDDELELLVDNFARRAAFDDFFLATPFSAILLEPFITLSTCLSPFFLGVSSDEEELLSDELELLGRALSFAVNAFPLTNPLSSLVTL